MNVLRLSPAFPESLAKDAGVVVVALVAMSETECQLIAAACPQRPLDVCKHFITPLVSLKLQQLLDEITEASKPVKYAGPRSSSEGGEETG